MTSDVGGTGAGQSSILPELLYQHLLIGRFLAGVGGKYITHMLAPGEVLNETDAAGYRDLDVRVWAKNANEVGRCLFEQWGIKLG